MKQFIVDAFTDSIFKGNPAAVCVLSDWLSADLMLAIARENNLSETAFAVELTPGRYGLRWFTPGGEIDLCGHATLATAFVISQFYETDRKEWTFETLSGDFTVEKQDDYYEMTFPAYDLKPVPATDDMGAAFGGRPVEAFLGRDLLCVFEDEDFVRCMSPDAEKLSHLPGLLQHATVSGDAYDCVSRSFAPKLSVQEDPVCGSGHCHIVPYWAEKLGKSNILAFQASERTGILRCQLLDRAVKMAGQAVLFAKSELAI